MTGPAYPAARMVAPNPVEGNVATTVHPTQLGGTRHLSAAQFVHDQRDTVALVASKPCCSSSGSHNAVVSAFRRTLTGRLKPATTAL